MQSLAKNAAFEQGLQMFTQALDVWLPAFGTANATQSGTSSAPCEQLLLIKGLRLLLNMLLSQQLLVATRRVLSEPRGCGRWAC
jgi:hypothetical protein